MTENARRERDAALAALESHPGADESVVALPQHVHPTGPLPIVQPPTRGQSTGVVVGGGVFAVLTALDQWLKANGVTLADLTMNSGPLSGGLVANGSIVILGLFMLWWASQRWREHVTRSDLRAAAQDRNSRNQVRAIRAVADEVAGLRSEVATQAAIARDHAGRLDAVERDVKDLRGRLPEPRRQQHRAPD